VGIYHGDKGQTQELISKHTCCTWRYTTLHLHIFAKGDQGKEHDDGDSVKRQGGKRDKKKRLTFYANKLLLRWFV
jgi:hypothetical protein